VLLIAFIKAGFFVFGHGTISYKYHPGLGLEIILVWMCWFFCRNAASFNKSLKQVAPASWHNGRGFTAPLN